MHLPLALICTLVVALLPGVSIAADPTASDPAAERIRERLASVRPNLDILAIQPSAMPGMYVVDVNGGVLYVSADARFLLPGKLYGLTDTDLVDLDADRQAKRRADLIHAVDLDDMIVFRPAGDVFTDVDCGYCRKLHQEVKQLNDLGIEIRYLAYPRAGINSDSYARIVSAWCADDRQSALTTLKAGGNVPQRSCDNPVAEQYLLGQKVGVTGTPSLVTDDGIMFPGYVPALQLAKRLGI